MELKQIKELMAAMGRTGIKKLSIKKEEFELTLEREEMGSKGFLSMPDISEEGFKSSVDKERVDIAFLKGSEGLTKSMTSSAAPEAGGPKHTIISPMVGTVYTAPSPDDPPFIKVGDRVEKNTIVCIVEAMKVMNEIKAGVNGVIAEVLVENGHPVEFGSKLFRVS